jgi:ParB family chromosome partitioning protein
MHKALGRGLGSLIPAAATPQAAGTPSGDSIISISVDKIKANKYQPRTEFNDDKLKELAESIKQHGIAQPLLVTATGVSGEYELIAGERRLRASKLAGLKEVPAIVRKADAKQKFHLALIENIQREDLNPIEEAKAFKRLADEFGYTQEELAHILGKDRSVVANSLRLLNLPSEVQEGIIMGVYTAGHGRILAGLSDEAKQKQLAERIIREKLTVRDVERIVADWKTVIKAAGKKAKISDAELTKLAEDLQQRFGTKVIVAGKPQKGRIELHYFSLEELERIVAHLRK